MPQRNWMCPWVSVLNNFPSHHNEGVSHSGQVLRGCGLRPLAGRGATGILLSWGGEAGGAPVCHCVPRSFYVPPGQQLRLSDAAPLRALCARFPCLT